MLNKLIYTFFKAAQIVKQDIIVKRSRTKLMEAVRCQSKESVKEVLNCSAIQHRNIFLTDMNGRTALFYAAERGDEEIVWMLLSRLTGTGLGCQRGALLNIKDKKGNRAEDWARINGQEEMRKLLSIERQRIEFFE